MTEPTDRTDREILTDDLLAAVCSIGPSLFRSQRGRTFGVDITTEGRLSARWTELVKTGPGRLLVDQFVDEWDDATSTVRRRRELFLQLGALVDAADPATLDTLEQVVAHVVFESRSPRTPSPPPILTREQDEAVLVTYQADLDEASGEPIIHAPIIVDVPHRICFNCGKPIVYDGDKINTDEPEPGRGWIHATTDRVECDLDCDVDGTAVATPHDPAWDKEPL